LSIAQVIYHLIVCYIINWSLFGKGYFMALSLHLNVENTKSFGAHSTYGNLNAYKILVGKSEGRRSLGRIRHSWEDIKMDLRETLDVYELGLCFSA
jgi:hypothetical protein